MPQSLKQRSLYRLIVCQFRVATLHCAHFPLSTDGEHGCRDTNLQEAQRLVEVHRQRDPRQILAQRVLQDRP